MSVFLKVTGAALMMLGVGVAVYLLTKPGVLDALGIRLDTAALLFIGGLLASGQSSIIDALRTRPVTTAVSEAVVPAAYVADNITSPVAAVTANIPAPSISPAFGRKSDVSVATVGMATVAGAGLAAVAAKATSKDPVADTINALEQAKADVIKSIGGMDASTQAPSAAEPVVAHAPEPAAVDEETADAPELDEDGLYVVEEKVVRGRPARVLSDDTVEAETDEGWMRFENMEHLNEYLDSVEEQSA